MISSDPMPPEQGRVLLFHDEPVAAVEAANRLGGCGFVVMTCADAGMALAVVYGDPPDLIVIHNRIAPAGGVALARGLRADNAFAHIPILLLVPPGDLRAVLEQDDYPFDDYVSDDGPEEDLTARARLALLRAQRQLDANPLTRLPGNNSIQKELERRLARGEEFATVYADLDNFKAFNDRYGFARGDEALKMTARLIVSCVSSGSPRDFYVGHVGGDDYVFLLPADRAEVVCREIVANFDRLVRSLYDDAERRQGCIQSTNRRGEHETFPLMGISLAVVPNSHAQFRHPGQICALAAELKKRLKKNQKSGYLVDQRDHRESPGPANE